MGKNRFKKLYAPILVIFAIIISSFQMIGNPKNADAATETVSLIRQNCSGYSSCYNSLSSWEANYGGINFGACAKGDLVCAGKIAVAKIDGTWTNPDATPVVIDGWNTGANNYIKIYTAPEARHNGKWNENRYRLAYAGRVIKNIEPYTKIDGIQIDGKNSPSQNILSYQDNIEISNSIFKNGGTALYLSGKNVKVRNSYIYDSTEGLRFIGSNGSFCNNTFANNSSAIYLNAGSADIKNSLFSGNKKDLQSYGSGALNAIYSATNLSQSASGLPGTTGNKFNQTFKFTDSTARDLHLTSADSGAKDKGTGLSADANMSFSDDIDGEKRNSPWDIGADEITSAASSTTQTNQTTDTSTSTNTSSTNTGSSVSTVTTKFSYYVNPSASGKNDGSDWTNAFKSLPSALTRNTTYYLADGDYSSYTFDDAGADWIYIRKATAANHGTSTGWQSSFGDGTAIFSAPLTFSAGNYEIDGQTGGGPGQWTSGHGIKIQHTGSSSKVKIISILNNVSNLTFKHVEMAFTPCSSCTGQDVIYGVNGGSNWKFQNCYMHHPSRVIFYTINVFDILVENSQLERSGVNSSSAQHSEVWSSRTTDNVIFRNNIVQDFVSTGGIMIGNSSNWDIYGNIFRWASDLGSAASNGVIGTWSDYYAKNINIFNNSFFNLTGGGSGRIFPMYSSITNVKVYNNAWYNSPTTIFGANVVHDYNLFINSNESKISESHKQAGSGTTFSSISNFTLAGQTDPGISLSSPYNQDMDSKIRGADGNWDRGALEYNK